MSVSTSRCFLCFPIFLYRKSNLHFNSLCLRLIESHIGGIVACNATGTHQVLFVHHHHYQFIFQIYFCNGTSADNCGIHQMFKSEALIYLTQLHYNTNPLSHSILVLHTATSILARCQTWPLATSAVHLPLKLLFSKTAYKYEHWSSNLLNLPLPYALPLSLLCKIRLLLNSYISIPNTYH